MDWLVQLFGAVSALATVGIALLTYLAGRHAKQTAEEARGLIDAQLRVNKRDYWDRRLISMQADLDRVRSQFEGRFEKHSGTDPDEPLTCLYWGGTHKLAACQNFLGDCRRRMDCLDVGFEGTEWEQNTAFIAKMGEELGNWLSFFRFKDKFTSEWVESIANEGKDSLIEFHELNAEEHARCMEELERTEAEQPEQSSNDLPEASMPNADR